jgi:sterol desaturase/sphingolipid hydroxylase (fatty acid hydroxylase superfamily)
MRYAKLIGSFLTLCYIFFENDSTCKVVSTSSQNFSLSSFFLQNALIFFAVYAVYIVSSYYRTRQAIKPWLITFDETKILIMTLLSGYPAFLCIDNLIVLGYSKVSCNQGYNLEYIFLYIFVSDLLFYFVHRLMHDIPFMYRIHKVHHSVPNDEMSSIHNFILSPADSFIHAICFTSVGLFVPTDRNVHYLFIFLNALYGMFAHEISTASIYCLHRLHHTKNYKNFGLYYMLCDRYFETFESGHVENHKIRGICQD